ncbi:PH domain-containing protein [Diaporthe helianthi]|uniref:PH domain-containing protein n=1 Tax=Diaporthe helianthi TaxID=158607 RepID=A0A2P5HKT1_DIAHE|nr:PH domain-containing protein [Diaporthe helianthi]
MSQLSGHSRQNSHSSTPNSSPPHDGPNPLRAPNPHRNSTSIQPSSPIHPSSPVDTPATNNPRGRNRSNSGRPMSMVQTFQPPLMDVGDDTPPELQPIFTFLNSHSNKLYQEGYFLKLDDQNTHGRPNPDRTWTECFAQLVGTVLSLWDAAELDAAGEDGEVLPKFINLTDASIKMIESLPTRSKDEQPLQNILSISTAGRNRYLLHFNSHHSLLQWTAGIRLAMFEHSTLQEAYTGALIAGKGRTVNNINLIMERARFKTEAWVRVRFGAGVPWRRCWCVISPPDEKEFQRHQKELRKRSPYDHSKPPVLKGDVKFYDTKKDGKKQKKTKPIASITDAYSCYAIYPQAKSLIDASTLIKIECNITIHSDPPSSTEGFVFIMPEVPPAVNGFEMLLRFMFPTWDTFGLYGRPGRLVASVLDARSLMFAMPKHRRYGYLEILDVTNLILTEGSGSWSEREWKKKLKELTGQRMNAVDDTPAAARSDSRRSKRLSIGPSVPAVARSRGVGFADDGPSVRASRSFSASTPGPRNDSAPPGDRSRVPNAMAGVTGHQRNSSDTQIRGATSLEGFAPHLQDERPGPTPPRGHTPVRFANDLAPTPERVSSEDDQPGLAPPVRDLEGLHNMSTPEPVQAPPSFQHAATARPQRAYHSPELRRATSRLSSATLQQLGVALQTNTDPALMEGGGGERHSDEQSAGSSSGQADPRGLAVPTNAYANSVGMSANENRSREGLSVPGGNPTPPRSPGMPPPQMNLEQKRSRSPLAPGAHGDGQRRPSPGPGPGQGPGSGPGPYPPSHGGRGHYPPGPGPTGSRGPPPPPHGGGRGRGMPPPGYSQDSRGPPPGVMGPPGPQNQHQPYHPGPGGPPPNSRRTPPPGAQRKQLPPLQTVGSPPIQRKPLPVRTDSLQSKAASSRQGSSRSNTGNVTPVSPSTNSSLRNHILEEAAFQLVNSPEAHSRDYDQQDALRRRQRQGTMMSEASSNYDDTASTDSPDYASTRKSSETQESRERPRAGVLKTVGDTAASDSGSGRSRVDMPDINFGPTFNLAHGAERTAAGGPWVPPNPPAAQPPRSFSPGPRKTPAPTTPSANITPFTAEFGHARNESEDTLKHRSVAWQPGVAVGGGSGRDGVLSPEEFVAQRAAAAPAPQYAHQRTPSGNALANMAPSPPLVKRSGSQDHLTKRHSRSGSADLLNRPPSRGSGNILGMNGSGGASTTLSAREQEHLARTTGTPLISMATNSPGPQAQGPGMSRGGYPGQQPGPPRSATLSPPPVGIGMPVSPISPRSMSPGPRYAMSPPPLQQGGPQYGYPQGVYGNPGMQPPILMNSPGPGQGPMRMASPGPGQGPMRMASPGPGVGPMRMQSPGPGQMRKASPGPGGFSRPMMMPSQGQFAPQGPRTPGTPGTPGTPRGPMPPHQQGHAF